MPFFPLVLVPPQLFVSPEVRRVGAAKTDLVTLRLVLIQFYRDTGRYPTAKEGLAVLVQKHASIKGWKGPYVAKMSLDPWRHPYVYAREGRRFTVTCYGADGKERGEGTAADLMVEG